MEQKHYILDDDRTWCLQQLPPFLKPGPVAMACHSTTRHGDIHRCKGYQRHQHQRPHRHGSHPQQLCGAGAIPQQQLVAVGVTPRLIRPLLVVLVTHCHTGSYTQLISSEKWSQSTYRNGIRARIAPSFTLMNCGCSALDRYSQNELGTLLILKPLVIPAITTCLGP